MEISRFFKKPEGKTLEFKRDLSSPNGVLRTITAFANTAGGTLIIGVEDKTRHIRGVEDPLNLEERIASLITDNISPRIIPEIDIASWKDSYLIIVQVFPSSNRPHFIKKNGLHDGIYIRVGSTNRKADKEVIEELKRITQNQSFDEEPLPELNSEAIDFNAASEEFADIRSLKKKDLESLGLVVKYQNVLVPTVAGVLLFGKDRNRYFPDAWIQCGRFKGKDKTHIIDSVSIHSYPTIAVNEAIAFVEKHAMKALEIGRVKHKPRWSIPHAAVRESIINAIVHADYNQKGAPIRIAIFDNRIEIENPGLLRFGLTTDDIKGGLSKLRNRTMGRIFHTLGIIERWGSGVGRIINSCKEGQYPEPFFEEIGTHFRVTLFTTRLEKPKLDVVDNKIIKLLQQNYDNGLSTGDISKKIKLSSRATRTRLIKLISLGFVVEIASSPQDPNRLYFPSI